MNRTRVCVVFLSKKVDQSHLTMESFKLVLVFNTSAQMFPNYTPGSFTNFLFEQLNMEGQWEVAISELSYPSMYQNVTEGKFMFLIKRFSKLFESYCLEPCLYSSMTDIVEAMNNRIQEKHNHSET